MKKLICLFAAIILTTSILFGCSSSPKFSGKDLTIVNTETKEEISIGMSRAEIEEKIGEPNHDTLSAFNRYDGLIICYYENEAVAFVFSNPEEGQSSWKTKRGISTKSSIKEVTKAYGGSFKEDNSRKSLALYFDENFKLYDDEEFSEEFKKKYNDDFTSDELQKELNDAQKYMLSFDVKDGELSIWIGFYENIRLGKYDS